MLNRKWLILFLWFHTLINVCIADEMITSPDGKIVVFCSLHTRLNSLLEEERFYYNVCYKTTSIIQDSPLEIEFKNADPLDSNFRIYNIKRTQKNEWITPFYGTQKRIRNNYNEITFYMQEKDIPFRLFQIIFRVSNEGIAFRYVFQQQAEMNAFQITNENSLFDCAEDYLAYVLPLNAFNTAYESNIQPMTISKISQQTIIGLPLLIDTNSGVWMAITEADLENYAGMYLTKAQNSPYALESTLSPRRDAPDIKVIGSTPFQTPWRVILIGEEPGDLIESNFIFTLNDTCVIDDPSWIRPGKCVWPGWSDYWVGNVDFEGGINTETMLYYLEFARENGFEYLQIDANWYGNSQDRNEDITIPIPELNLPAILNEAKKEGVGIILSLFWECVQDQMDYAFPLYQKWGVSGVQINYINHDDQEMVNFIHDVIQKASQHHLLVNLHGFCKPTGIQRTYPNLITQEAVLGLEYAKTSRLCDPEHELMIPFTRMLAGPMDFTPGCFRTVTADQFDYRSRPPQAMGTQCHQLAMYVIYESPLQMVVDTPDSNRSRLYIDFLRAVPTTWDTTIVLNGRVGDYITIARKYGKEWFIGSMTDWTARELSIPLNFLKEGEYTTDIFMDHPNIELYPKAIIYRNSTVQPSDILTVPLIPGGGYVARLTPIQ
ncbi:glycoside hydrolase family 97 protein [bacterium]|nr:glycoside hydrolase family 97 protein [bacterium]